jgi:two-component system sensor histidine kinase/response regulator
MIKEQILIADHKKFSAQTSRDRGLLQTLGAAWRERPSARHRTGATSHLVDVMEATPDFVFTADEDGHLLYCNRSARGALGISEESVPNIHLTDIYPEQARTRVLGEGVFTAILDGVWTGETTIVSKTGREIPVSLVIVAPLATDGHSEFLSIVARDISASKQKQTKLEEDERFYRRIVQTANMGMWVIDSKNRTSFVNSKMAKLLGCEPDEIVGKPIVAFMDEEGIALADAQREVILNGVDESQDYKLIRKDGSELWVRLCTSPLFDEEEQFMGTLAFVTECGGLRRRIEQVKNWVGVR